ncbi:MAG: hypothetical protein M1347_01800 [Chloroflexi bacterium]|nr:hypothetical protein [Chloroflexota bacterium]
MKNKLVVFFRDFHIPEKNLPWLFLGICVLAFGLLIPSLGYYWDDWLTLYLMKTNGAPGDFVYAAFRPLHAVLDVIEFLLLGSRPMGWHILSLVLRWVAVVLVWQVMRQLTRPNRELAAWISILFAIYPSFYQQSSALVYRQHWTTYIFYLLSLLLMISSTKANAPRRYFLTVLGLIFTLAHLLTTEYLVGLEILRPFVLWIVIRYQRNDLSKRISNVLRFWWPYLLVGAGFLVWRMFILQLPEDPNPPILFYEFLSAPLQAVTGLVQTSLQDMLSVLWSSWAALLTPSLFDFSDRFGVFVWGLVVGLIPILLFLLSKIRFDTKTNRPVQQVFTLLLFGLVAVFFGLATSWLVGRQVTEGRFSDRLSIPAILGASIIIAQLIIALVPRAIHRNLILAVMVSLAIGAHLRTANDYRWDWEKQMRFVWQTYWRAPSLEPGTLLIGEGAVSEFLDDYNAAFALNLMYASQANALWPAYWYESFYSGLHRQAQDFQAGVPIETNFYGIEFSGNTQRSIMVYQSSAQSPCFWYLNAFDEQNLAIDEPMRALVAYTDPDLIQTKSGDAISPPAEIFGPEPSPDWCTYFQKASLAQQQADWAEVLRLWDSSQKDGAHPYDGYELLPFINAYAYFGNWDRASYLSRHAYQISPKSQAMLCAAWERYSTEPINPLDFELTHQTIKERLACP